MLLTLLAQSPQGVMPDVPSSKGYAGGFSAQVGQRKVLSMPAKHVQLAVNACCLPHAFFLHARLQCTGGIRHTVR